jgi:hypothetical protein
MRAKYCPQKEFWLENETVGSSSLWKAIQSIKHLIKDDISCVLGIGTQVDALNEPWIPDLDLQPRINMPTYLSALKVADLVYPDTEQWCPEMLVHLFGQDRVDHIFLNIKPPKREANLPDRLIWKRYKRKIHS